jgi:hypothetical protein
MRADEGGPGAQQIDAARSHALFDQARAVVGDRFAEARVDPDGGLRVTVVDLSQCDVAVIGAVAHGLGIAGRVSSERADPAALEMWERLRHEVRALPQTRPQFCCSSIRCPSRGIGVHGCRSS